MSTCSSTPAEEAEEFASNASVTDAGHDRRLQNSEFRCSSSSFYFKSSRYSDNVQHSTSRRPGTALHSALRLSAEHLTRHERGTISLARCLPRVPHSRPLTARIEADENAQPQSPSPSALSAPSIAASAACTVPLLNTSSANKLRRDATIAASTQLCDERYQTSTPSLSEVISHPFMGSPSLQRREASALLIATVPPLIQSVRPSQK